MKNKKGFLSDFNGISKPPITRENLSKQLYSIMKNISCKEIVELITNKFEEIINYAELSNGAKTCQKMSLLFNPHRLEISSRTSKKDGIVQYIKSETFADNLSRAILYRRYNENIPVGDLLYRIFQWQTGGMFYPHEFPPHVARDLCIKYGCNSGSKILDPCAGWGGRMIGVSIVTNYYECFEPSIKTFEGLLKLYNFLKQMNKEFCAVINNSCFEDSNLTEQYDFALTSPPYYNTEVYSDEETNSCNRYFNFDQWVDKFYLPLVEKTMRALKPGKCFILNIGSRVYPLNEILIDNFGKRFKIFKDKNFLAGTGGGLGKKGEGETFYMIKNN